MVKKSDDDVRRHFEVKDNVFQCKHCGDKFNGKPSVTRLRSHLLGERKKGINICEKVAEHVKLDIQVAHSNKRPRMLESCSVNNQMRNHTSTSLAPQDNDLVQEQAALQNEFHGVKQAILDFSNPEPVTKQPRARHHVPLLTSELVGKPYKRKLEEIWSSLKKENVFKIGIYGMGGAGKTELAKHIYNRLLEYSDHDFVCWITVSPNFNICKLQKIIANAINFELPNKDVEVIKAELSRRLFDKKFVIILDDLWCYISLDDLGMTDGSLNGCKLIITTHSLHICRTMNCQENVLVNCHEYLHHNEQWNIFKKELNEEGILSGEIELVAKSIVEECEGLPLMIKCMARSMRGVEDIEEWSNVLEEMKSCKMKEPYVEVFRQLRRSYEHLKDQLLRHCFLFCALFDESIEKEELMEHLIAEGIAEGRGNRLAKHDRAYSLLNNLHNVCLLSYDGHIRMDGLIRKMAYQIMKENLQFKLEFSEEIKYLFMEDKMSISVNLPNKVVSPSDYVAACPNMSTLLIRGHWSLTSIEDSFFRFQILKVLSLSSIVELPKSVGDLKNLKALFLRRCSELKDVPSLAKLESLEVLDLSYSAVVEVPEGVESLFNLRVLNLFWSGIEEIKAGILTRLSRLEFLAFDKPSKLGEEIASLSKLESLIWNFSDIHKFDSFLSKTSSPSLNAYSIHVGQQILHDCSEPRHGRIALYNFEVEREYLFCLSSCPTLLERVEEVELSRLCYLRHVFGREIEDGVSPNTTPPQTSPFPYLKTFDISNCDSIENLFPLHLLSNLQNLQNLSVSGCSAMEEIIAAPEQDLTNANSHPNSIHQAIELSLPKLKTLFLRDLPKLTSICPAQINCKSLCEITIYCCKNLKKIPISLPLPSLHVLKVSSKTWWDSVSWGSSDQKANLEPDFKPTWKFYEDSDDSSPEDPDDLSPEDPDD